MSGKNNRIRGFSFEREIVNKAKESGLEAKRAWGSNGLSLGEAETVDCVIDGIRFQAKRRKSVAAYLRIPEGADALAFREERSPAHVVITLEEWIRLRLAAKGASDVPVEKVVEKTKAIVKRKPTVDWMDGE